MGRTAINNQKLNSSKEAKTYPATDAREFSPLSSVRETYLEMDRGSRPKSAAAGGAKSGQVGRWPLIILAPPPAFLVALFLL